MYSSYACNNHTNNTERKQTTDKASLLRLHGKTTCQLFPSLGVCRKPLQQLSDLNLLGPLKSNWVRFIRKVFPLKIGYHQQWAMLL